ncbi:hypothetical protein CD30_05690 [Ureibacillus massiliensis 4400831 = CIP 108448 = CCUG 49529]|uniref:Uncharacterized protein n=1 Tax=Ureibacillus massiliensis 4400831 = CIP 108448 = CCUG 49529 TaxID=1211035 RepID=A0A0A3J3C8_9BACL|nr:hypothetical protein [Ureibacillus massiliensis]KGR91544.1 hypothetical protein CD30_05690 [Ureibacillus massiliensis 4400831 = CIP 108448 = CCUG 49529]
MESLELKLLLWFFIIFSLMFIIRGVQKKSKLFIYFGTIVYFLSTLYLAQFDQQYFIYSLFSIIPFVFSFFIKKQEIS